MNLKRKVGPLPLWAWVTIGGVGIGAIVLAKKSKAKTAGETEAEPIPSSLASPFGPEAGSGGGGTTAASENEAKQPAEVNPALPQEHTPVSEFLSTLSELEAGGFRREAPGTVQGATGSTVGQVHASRINSQGGNPRKGSSYTDVTYKGQRAHRYGHAVPGGVGPGHNIIVLGHAGKKTHSAKPHHGPAHVKAKHKPKAKAHHPTHHTHKPAHPKHHRSKARAR